MTLPSRLCFAWKKKDFSWKQLAVDSWGTNSPHPPALYLIINIINPEWGGGTLHIPCVFSSSFHAKTAPMLVAVAKLAGIVLPSLDDL